MSRLAAVVVCLVLGAAFARADARKDCYEKSGDLAIRACTEAIGRDPADVVSLVNRAFEYSQKGDFPRSIADYNKAIELEPSRWDALHGRAWAYLKSGKAAEGLADAERAVQIKPNEGQSLDVRGHAYEALGRREEAIADYRRALAVEPLLLGSKQGLRRLGVSQ
jgi:tetratricopeptide (TPR) repeat protein